MEGPGRIRSHVGYIVLCLYLRVQNVHQGLDVLSLRYECVFCQSKTIISFILKPSGVEECEEFFKDLILLEQAARTQRALVKVEPDAHLTERC